jgi:hypothetical protein
MTYNICETCLLIPVDLNRSECAAWVQAIGSIIAISVSIWIANFQSIKQQELTRTTLLEQQRQINLSVAETLNELAKKSLELQKYFTNLLSTREAVYQAIDTKLIYDMTLLHSLESALIGIELHKLPASLVSLSLILTATIQQLRVKIENVINTNRLMNSEHFDDLFKTLNEMQSSLTLTVKDFQAALETTKNNF